MFAETFEHAAHWLSELRDHADANIVNILVGNKCDLKHMRNVTTEDAQEFCTREGITLIETSACEATNVETAFLDLVTKVYHLMYQKMMLDPDVGLKPKVWHSHQTHTCTRHVSPCNYCNTSH